MKNKLKACFIIAVLKFTARLSLPVNHAIGSLIGTVLYYFPSRIRYVTTVNISHCFPQLTAKEQNQLIRDNLREVGKSFMEAGINWLQPVGRCLANIISVEGEDLIHDAIEKKQALIFLSPHLGNWEMLNLYLSTHYQMWHMYLPPKLVELDNFLQKSRSRTDHGNSVPATMNGVKTLLKMLLQGKFTGILPDQEPRQRDKGGVFVPFFSIPAWTDTFVVKLLQKSRARVIFTYARRVKKGKGYELIFRSPPESLYSNDVMVAARALNEGIENCIKETPEQYLWCYKRFKTRPEGEAKMYLK